MTGLDSYADSASSRPAVADRPDIGGALNDGRTTTRSTIAGDTRMLIEPIDVMVFGEDGKVTAMKAYWSPENARQV